MKPGETAMPRASMVFACAGETAVSRRFVLFALVLLVLGSPCPAADMVLENARFERRKPVENELEPYVRFRMTETGISPISHPGLPGGNYLARELNTMNPERLRQREKSTPG
jgi:hypothetical protein